MKKRSTFRQYVRRLRKYFPTDKPVRVVRVVTDLDKSQEPFQREFGETLNYKGYYLIRINRADPLKVQKDTMDHEWAHCMTSWNCRDDHGRAWALNYAKIYREMSE